MPEKTPPTAVLVNGTADDRISVLDRGLQYGDGLFETLPVIDGQPQWWSLHMDRLLGGCARLGIVAPDVEVLQAEAQRLCAGQARAVLKIIITRGAGGRGYRPPSPARPTRVLSLHAWPTYPDALGSQGIELRVCSTRWGTNPALAGLKHLNRLEQVLARAEWEGEAAEGLMLDSCDRVISGTMSNLFLVREGKLRTPDLSQCGIAGITRARILELANRLTLASVVEPMGLDEVLEAEELFVCNSLIGIWPVRRLAGRGYPVGRETRALMDALSRTTGH